MYRGESSALSSDGKVNIHSHWVMLEKHTQVAQDIRTFVEGKDFAHPVGAVM